jgi:hypothetical protein
LENNSTSKIGNDFVQVAKEISSLVNSFATTENMTYAEYDSLSSRVKTKISKLMLDVKFLNNRVHDKLLGIDIELLKDMSIIGKHQIGLMTFEVAYQTTKLRKDLAEHYTKILKELEKSAKEFSKKK